MKRIYYADAATHVFMGSRSVPDDYKPKANESFDNPSGLQLPQKLTSTGWVAATDEEHKAYLEAQQKKFLAENPQLTQPSQPADDKSDQAINSLGQQIAKMQAMQEKMQGTQTTMAQSINALGQLVAKAQTPAVQQPTEPAQSGNQTTEPQA